MRLYRSACVGVTVDLPPPPSSTALADDTPTGGHAHSSWQTMPQFHPSGLQSSACKVHTISGVINRLEILCQPGAFPLHTLQVIKTLKA